MNAEPALLIIVLHDDLAPGHPAARAARLLEAGLGPALDALAASPQLKLAWAPSPALLRAIGERPDAATWVERLRAGSARGRLEGVVRAHSPLALVPEAVGLAQLRQQQAVLQRVLGTPARGFWPEALAWDPVLPARLARAGLGPCFVDGAAVAASGVRPDAGAALLEREGLTIPGLCVDRRLSALAPGGAVGELALELKRRRGATLVLALGLGPLCAAGPSFWAQLGVALVRLAKGLRLHTPTTALDKAPLQRAAPRAGTPPAVGADLLPEAAGEALLEAEAAVLGLRDPVLAAALGDPLGPPLEAGLGRFDAAARLLAAAWRLHGRVAAARKRADPAAEGAAAAALRVPPSAALYAGEGGGVDDPAVRHAAAQALLAAEAPLLSAELSAPARPHEPGAVVELRAPWGLLSLRPAEGGGVDRWLIVGLGDLVNTAERVGRAGMDALRRDSSLPELVTADLGELPEDEDTDPGARAPASEADTAADPARQDGLEALSEALGGDTLGHAAAGPRPVRAPVARSASVADSRRLIFEDGHLRHLLVERIMGEGLSARALWRGQAPRVEAPERPAWQLLRAELGADGVGEIVLVREIAVLRPPEPPGMIQLTRRLRVLGDRPALQVEWELINRSREPVDLRLLVELNVNLDGRRGPERSLHTPGAAPRDLLEIGEVEDVSDIGLRFGDLGALLRVQTAPACRLLHHPIEAPALRDGVWHDALQGVCLGLDFAVSLWGEEKQRRSATVELLRRG